ncbi:MAG: cadherin-like domain-containing protein [Phycisphaerales bacterium]|nr:cadherin-like domain-containing protein [Phycisphaerales bacterium]
MIRSRLTAPFRSAWFRHLLAMSASLTALVLIAAPASGAVVVDDFSTTQPVVAAPGSSLVNGGGILGGQREMDVSRLAGASAVTAQVSAGSVSLTVGANSRGEVELTYDGPDNDTANLDPLGLGGVDLTDDGGTTQTGLRVTVDTVVANTEIDVVVTSSTGVHRGGAVIDAAGTMILGFSEFLSDDGSLADAADFVSVGAIQVVIRAAAGGAAAVVTASLVDTTEPTIDASHSDGVAGAVAPGGTVTYTTTITNSGGAATGTALDDEATIPLIDPNVSVVAGSLRTSPVAGNNVYRTVGNVSLQVAAAPAGAGIKVIGSVLDNDIDPDADAQSVAVGAVATEQGGTATLSADGTFTYDPPAGFSGTDQFVYSMVVAAGDPAPPASSNQGRVTVFVDDLVWFVDEDVAGPGTGTLADPFNDFSQLNGPGGAGDVDEPNHIIFVREANTDGVIEVAGLNLEDGQRLFGEGIDLILAGEMLIDGSAAQRPRLDHPADHGVILASNNEIRGLNIGNTPAHAGIMGSSFGTLTLADVEIMGTGAALDLDTGTLAATFDHLTSTGSTGATAAIDLDGVTGSLTVNGATTISDASGAGIRVQNGGSTYDFAATTITDTGAGGATGHGVQLLTSATSTFIFDSLSVTTEGGAGILANNAGTINIAGNTNTISAGGGPGLDVTSTALDDGTASGGVTFAAVSSSGSPTTGVNLVGITGDVTANGGTITGSTGTAFNVDGGASAVVYAGSVTQNNAARVINIEDTTGGGVTFQTGTVTGGAASLGVRIHNADGNASFADLNLGTSGTPMTNTALTLTGGSAGTMSFAGTQIFTIGARGIDANNGGVVEVTGAGNQVTTTSARAITFENGTTIGASGATFQRVDASGSDRGIRLSSAGSGFTITGNGPNGTNGSGGTFSNLTQRGIEVLSTNNVTLQNLTMTSVSTTDAPGSCDNITNSGCHAAVHLGTVTTAVLDNVDIGGTNQIGVNGSGVSAFSLRNSTILNAGDEVDEGGLQMFGLTGTSDITASDIGFPSERAGYIRNTTAGNLVLTVDGSTFRDTQSSGDGADGLELAFSSSATATIDVINSSFRRNRTNGLQVIAEDTSNIGIDITGSTFDRETGIGIGMDLATADSAQLTFNVIGNPIVNSRGSNAINVFGIGPSIIRGRINNNTDVQAGGATESGFGIRAQVNENARAILEISGNTVSNIGFDAGIQVIARGLNGTACGTTCTAGRLDATINNNTVTVDATNSLYDVWVQASDSNTTCANVTNSTTSGGGIAGFRERTASANSTVLLQGFSSNATTTWTNNGNTPAGSVSSSNNGTLSGGTCATVSHPMP